MDGSLRAFLVGVARRYYLWASSILLDPFEFYERYFKSLLPPRFRVNVEIPWQVFASYLVATLLLAAYLTYRDLWSEKVRLEQRLEPKMKIIFEDRPPFVRGWDDPVYPQGLCRIGVKNTSGVTIQSLGVQLIRAEPPVLEHLPLPLHAMHDNPPQGQPSRREFSLNPEEILYVDVLLVPRPPDEIAVYHVVAGVEACFGPGRYELAIRAYAKDGPACEGWFVVESDRPRGEVSFRPLTRA